MPPFNFDLYPNANEILEDIPPMGTRLPEGAVNESAAFEQFLNENGGRLGVLKSAAQNLIGSQLNKARRISEELKGELKGELKSVVNAIGGPLGYNNPTVAVDSNLAGQRINPEALNWIMQQKYIRPTGTLDAMGGVVNAREYNYRDGHEIDIAFRNPTGFSAPSDIKQRIETLNRKLLDTNYKDDNFDNHIKEKIANLERELELSKGNPLMPQAIRYQLGRVIENAPVDTVFTATPIGGAGGSRARIYKGLSKGALETKPRFKPDYSRMPSEDEFRGASVLHTPADVDSSGVLGNSNTGYRSIDSGYLNQNAGQINTKKISPQEFLTATNKQITWNPAELKDPMLRAAFNLDKESDVSALRADPMSQFLNEGFIDINKPIITKNSPTYRVGRGIVNASKVGITDFIPSREVVSNLYNNQSLDAVKNYATEFIGGIPQALAVGGAIAAAPVLAPIATGLGGAMAMDKAFNAMDEMYKQSTGKTWTQRNKPKDTYSTYAGPTPTIQPRTGTAILGGRPVQVPYGSIAGQKTVGRPWWDKAGSQIEKFANLLNSGSIIGR